MMTTGFTTSEPRELELLLAAQATKAKFACEPPRKHTAILEKLIKDNEIVIAIYVESGQLRQHIVKGQYRLEMVARADAAIHVEASVIQVREAAEAEAIRQVFGDGARRH